SPFGVLRPVSENTDDFKNNILAPLQSAYLFEESKQSFRYKSGFLIKNPALEEKYNAYRAKRKDLGYSEEELKETYGFLLFDELSKAKAVGEGGVLTRNGTCSTLGDPSKGIYLSMYSDCLDLNSWYHGKSGYIAIIRLTQGRVKKVLENYTQNFTTPTVGFDCHVSEQLPTVSSKTSSFLAFERTQYYMYELLDSGSDKTAEAPSLVCPFAVVAFSYTDTKATTETTEEKRYYNINILHSVFDNISFIKWSTVYVGLRSTAGSLVRAKLPPVVKVERAISMLDLRQLLPRAAFETSFSGEGVFSEMLHLYERIFQSVSSYYITKYTIRTNVFVIELRSNMLIFGQAFTVPLDDAGFLILLHSSHFCMYENGKIGKYVLQGMFVFPDSQKRLAIPSDIQRALPLLTYAEGEAEKTLLNPSKERNKIIVQHMQSYAALINPVLALSPLREVSIFVDQYDVPDAHKHLYASPEWTDLSWQSFRSYLSKPVSFQVPVLTATEILAAGQEDRREELDDDVYICLSSPEEAPADFVSKASEEQVDQRFSPDTETSPAETSLAEVQTSLAEVETSLAEVETSLPEVETSLPEVETSLPEVEPSLADVETSLTDVETSLPEVESSLGDVETSIADAEASIADAETSIADAETSPADAGASLESHTTNMEKRLVVTAVPQNTVPDDFQDGEGKTSSTETEKSGLRNVLIPPISDDLPAELIVSITSAAQTVSEEDLTVISTASATKLNDSQLSVSSMEKLQMQKGSKHCTETPRLLSPSKVVPVKHDTGNVRRAKRKFGNLLSRREAGEEKQQDSPKDMLEDTVLHELEAYSLRKKTERWDLKPVISECGKILVPHGTLEFTDKIESLKGKLWSSAVEQCPEKMLVDAPVHTGTMGEMEHESNDVSETPQGKATVQEHLLETLSSMKCASKEETMLTKLKSVLFRSKRKGDHVSQKPNAETASDSEVSPKKIRSDLDDEMLKSNNAITCVQETNVCVQEVSKMLSVDLVFAQALGLTPKETPDKLQKAVGHKVQQRKDSPETEEQSIAHKQPQIILRPPSIFPRRSRIKMLKKHQSVPAEHIRSKCEDISVRKTVKERMRAACSPTDALNLLADLALSANKDQVPPQPAQALATKPESSLKNCDLTKGVTSPETESFLHALLRQPAARPIQPLEPPSPSPVLGGSELVDVVSIEHAYSLPPSSSLLLGLPGTPFQVSPLSGSTRLLLHPQQKYSDGTQTLQPSVYLEEKVELNQRTPGWLKKCTRRRKFRHSRTFVNKDRTVQVTRQWEENYDFNLDSRFTIDSLDKAVNRALHGPWDLSMYDTTEEVRLIIHMWIGLFYSRSTARFFHLDPNFTFSPSEDSNGLEMSSGKMSDALHSEPVSNDPVPSATDTSPSQALDLSKNSNSVLDQGSVLLDLSLRTTDPFNPTNTASKHFDGHQQLRNFSKKVGAAKSNLGEDPDDCLQPTSFVDYKTNKVTDDTLIPGTQTSLVCTVHNNTNEKSSCSFLEQVSSRCLQEDPTQASMDQECLIFSEQMKRLLKRQFPHQQAPVDKSELPCTGWMTVHFSSLDEEDDSSEDFEVLPSLVGQKIKVDMSDRNQLRDATEEKRPLQLQKISCDTRNPMDKVGVSAMTEECTRLYEDLMNDICSGLKVSSTTKHSQMHGGHPKSDPGNYFDFCSQMKRELDESFRSHLNSVVKKSCKTKYRFFMLVTSDSAFFEETKVHLEAEGHTAVHPSTFFLDEDSPSLLIIIRNEDIAEHICEVPHLLKLKMSKGVRFVGIDEPDDIVNLTHQELFNRGGFVMFDGAALDSLSLCNVKKLADVLQELSQTGKWKWFMHYRESRRLKENARSLSTLSENQEIPLSCQDEGILELLPYHECDLMSRQQPDYLTCLCHLQVQNISARYPVYVTGEILCTYSTFGKSHNISTVLLLIKIVCF
uniref:Uncharacterized LOC115421242 n=1 Tax=Sphaeramia orbicularis TaxID=375764 RepID=A0A673BWI8_9TELE